MGVRPYTDKRAEANKRYDDKTYKRVTFKLRIDDDADLIEAWKTAQDKGLSNREWLRLLIENHHG